MPIPVFLNIYDLIPDVSKTNQVGRTALETIGMGCYHTGLEILGREVSFGRDASGRNDPNMEGVFMVAPRTACAFWKEQVLLGMWASSSEPDTIDHDLVICHYEEKLEDILRALRPKWRAASYHMLSHNCNDFTFDLATAISCNGESRGVDARSSSLIDRYPSYINRGTGHVVPDGLRDRMLESIHPPPSCSSKLTNLIMIPSPFGKFMPAPLDFESTPIKRITSEPSEERVITPSSGFIEALHVAIGATKLYASSRIHANYQRDFQIQFGPMMGEMGVSDGCRSLSDSMVSAYTVTLRHINREQSDSKVFLNPQALFFHGPNELKLIVPWRCVGSIRLARVTEKCDIVSGKVMGVGDSIIPVYTIIAEEEVKRRGRQSSLQNLKENEATKERKEAAFAIMLFLTSIPPQLAPMTATIRSMMVEHDSKFTGSNTYSVPRGPMPPDTPMVIPMRQLRYGSYFNFYDVIQNALGHMNYLWQSSTTPSSPWL